MILTISLNGGRFVLSVIQHSFINSCTVLGQVYKQNYLYYIIMPISQSPTFGKTYTVILHRKIELK
jgi:hypothetical protein